MISNPVSEFINGNEHREFTYEGGSKLYHFSPKANGLSRYMDCNVVFFANSEDHALDVLKRMLTFVVAQGKIHQESKREEALIDCKRTENFVMWLRELEAEKVKVELAPTNQFYIVGWAANDTI